VIISQITFYWWWCWWFNIKHNTFKMARQRHFLCQERPSHAEQMTLRNLPLLVISSNLIPKSFNVWVLEQNFVIAAIYENVDNFNEYVAISKTCISRYNNWPIPLEVTKINRRYILKQTIAKHFHKSIKQWCDKKDPRCRTPKVYELTSNCRWQSYNNERDMIDNHLPIRMTCWSLR